MCITNAADFHVFHYCFFSAVVFALSSAYFGAGNGSVVAYDLGCAGTESNITSCSFQSNDANDACDHLSDASVACGQITGKLFQTHTCTQSTVVSCNMVDCLF